MSTEINGVVWLGPHNTGAESVVGKALIQGNESDFC
jgi:hypothetical protein